MQVGREQTNPQHGIGEGLPVGFSPTVVVNPPFVSDTELGVTAVDVALSGRLPNPTSGLVAFCLGGHPAAECLLDATGSGTDHQMVVAIDQTQPGHRGFALRLRGIVKPDTPLRVIPLPSGP